MNSNYQHEYIQDILQLPEARVLGYSFKTVYDKEALFRLLLDLGYLDAVKLDTAPSLDAHLKRISTDVMNRWLILESPKQEFVVAIQPLFLANRNNLQKPQRVEIRVVNPLLRRGWLPSSRRFSSDEQQCKARKLVDEISRSLLFMLESAGEK